MNITEALNVALPEIPGKVKEYRPRLHPRLVGREQIEDGQPVVVAIIEGKSWLFAFSPTEWKLVQLFDGKRSYEEIADLFSQQEGVQYSPDDLREFAATLDSNGFWYKTPQEENVALTQKLAEHRGGHAKKKSRFGDISHIQFSAWDPDKFFDKIHPKLTFFYSRWFTALTLAAFAFMFYVFIDRWGEIANDTIQFYDFTKKGAYDIAEFWVLVCILLFFHETAHGLSCKHYGGHVHRMGFHLVYLTPAFFTDVIEAWVYATRQQRLVIIVSGVWTEMMFSAAATPIWWGTPKGSWAHEFAYKIILITGLGVIFFNWNPLIKLDGYYLLTEGLGIPNLKEDSTAYVAGWVKKHIWRLPVEVPYVAKRRRLGYVVYALVSGVYSYSLLYLAARFVGNIARNYSPEWAFVPAVGVGYLIFRSRIRTLWRFMNTVYLDKKERLQAWLTPRNKLIAAAALLLFLVAPVWRETVEGRFLLEPEKRALLRAAVPGTVVEVDAEEGQPVAAGAKLLQLRNLALESEAAKSYADYRAAAARAAEAQLRYADFGIADRERQQLQERTRLLQEQVSMLTITSPIAGRVMTPRLSDRLGSRVEAGTELVEVAGLGTMRARIYLPEFAVRKAQPGEPARLLPDSAASPMPGRVLSIAPASSEIAAGLIHQEQYRGVRPPTFYTVTIEVPNPDGRFRSGMAGTALITAGHRSIAGMLAEVAWDFVRRKLW
ncbi:MAG TPA: HlyD family efflux transporter periplasmic adaptor subunit [Terriglobales bacterium]|nr:HlyD family efflux transporter periplasmic adaptor subunit [Terriglobales bacterium]